MIPLVVGWPRDLRCAVATSGLVLCSATWTWRRGFVGIILFWLKIGGYWFTNPGAEFPIMWMCLLILQIILGDGACALTIARKPAILD